MNENLFIAHKKKTYKNLACSQRQIHTVHTCKLSQAKTTKGHALIPTYPFPKVELYITVKYKNIYRVINNDNRKKESHTHTHTDTHPAQVAGKQFQ